MSLLGGEQSSGEKRGMANIVHAVAPNQGGDGAVGLVDRSIVWFTAVLQASESIRNFMIVSGKLGKGAQVTRS